MDYVTIALLAFLVLVIVDIILMQRVPDRMLDTIKHNVLFTLSPVSGIYLYIKWRLEK